MPPAAKPPGWLLGGYAGFTLLLNGFLLATMIWLFRTRWRVAD